MDLEACDYKSGGDAGSEFLELSPLNLGVSNIASVLSLHPTLVGLLHFLNCF